MLKDKWLVVKYISDFNKQEKTFLSSICDIIIQYYNLIKNYILNLLDKIIIYCNMFIYCNIFIKFIAYVYLAYNIFVSIYYFIKLNIWSNLISLVVLLVLLVLLDINLSKIN